jgi:2-keto-4-pentenoate hydratase/2-oxohepta-3-ene-1,7-dioic acid hydratase in catechol pathway
MTLYAGDVLLTGTPSGIGNARTPPVFLAQGDRLITRGSGLGELVNTMRTVDLTVYRT